MTVTLCIPSIPPRKKLLERAIMSALNNTIPPDAIAVAIDHGRQGAGPTRNRALQMARTEWIAFLDDDDQLWENHFEVLLDHAEETGADVVWPWFKVVGGTDPFPQHQGRQLDPLDPHIFPIVTLVRTSLAQQAEFPAPDPLRADWHGDDWAFWRKLQSLGAKFSHTPEVTWTWSHHQFNTSGLPTRW